MSTKPGSMPVLVLLISTDVQNISKLAFLPLLKDCKSCVTGLLNITVTMESTGKYWIPVFNILEKNNLWVTLSHPKYTKPQKGNKTDRKDAKWICNLYMCGMVK